MRVSAGRRGSAGSLPMQVHDVDAEAVDAAVEPEAQHVVHGLDDLRVVPVEVGLLGQEGVQVPLPGGLVPGPRADRRRRPPASCWADAVRRAVAPAVPVALGESSRRARVSTNHGCWSDVWLGTQSSSTRMSRAWASASRRVEGREVAEERVDVAVVGHVVAEVGHRRAVDRRQPERVDPEPPQVVEAPADARRGRRRRRRSRRRTSADRSGRRPTPATTCGGEGYGPGDDDGG